MSEVHPLFRRSRVAIVQMMKDKRVFGVAMMGGRHVVPLPEGYDGDRTMVHWVQGWIIVQHPDHPPLLADTSTGKTTPMNEHALEAAKRAYIPMLKPHRPTEIQIARA